MPLPSRAIVSPMKALRPTTEALASVVCAYPRACDYTNLDALRAHAACSGKVPAVAVTLAEGKAVFKDGMGRITTYTRSAKGQWRWVEASAKGKLRGRVLNTPALVLNLSRAIVSPYASR